MPIDMVKKEGAPVACGITVVIPTCNRGDSILGSVQSILKNDNSDIEIIVVDQSDDDATRDALKPFIESGTVTYFYSDIKGAGYARNFGVHRARHEFVALTDDDCIVAENWTRKIISGFQKHANIAVIYTNVLPAEHNQEQGFVPCYILQEDRLTNNIWGLIPSQALGASMAVRKSMFTKLGGFDELMGPGSPFRSASDRDIAIRAILNEFTVLEISETEVVHFGFRTWEEGRALTRRDWFGLGAMCSKPFKVGRLEILPMFLAYIFHGGIFSPIRMSLMAKKPTGFRRLIYFFQGFRKGIQTDLNTQTLNYNG